MNSVLTLQWNRRNTIHKKPQLQTQITKKFTYSRHAHGGKKPGVRTVLISVVHSLGGATLTKGATDYGLR